MAAEKPHPPLLTAGIDDAILETSASIEPQSLDLLCELTIAAGEGREAIDDVTASAMTALGVQMEHIDYAPRAVPLVDEFAAETMASTAADRCIIGRLPGDGGGRSLLLFAHPDTEEAQAAPAWETDPFSPTVKDDRLFGWGVADDLAGLAMLVQGVHLLKAANLRPKGDLVLVSAPSKKHRRGIAAALHRGISADAAIYLHPAESGRGLDEIKAYAPGQLEFMIMVRGQQPDTAEPAHTAFAHQAVNPFEKALSIAAALKAVDENRGRDRRHPTMQQAIGRSTNLMLTNCDVGSYDQLSRMPSTCRFGGALTLIPGEGLEEVMSSVEEALGAAAQRDDWLRDNPPIVEWLAGVSAAETDQASDLYLTVAGVLKHLGATPKVNPLHTSSDIRNPIVQKGMPTVGFGPRCGGLTMAGKTDEWVDITDFHRAVLATALVIAAWCGVATSSGSYR
ncbi:MAG: M20/M25/M40 family metallo-hydrolase [Pseudomonadota bacterium]